MKECFDTVIISGGNIQDEFVSAFLRRIEERQGGYPLLAAADRGLAFFWRNGLEPDLAIGDFDSAPPETVSFAASLENTEIIRLRPEKDDTDTQAALALLLARGSRRIALFGATGSRLDHMLANISLLLYARERGASLCILDPCNRAELAKSPCVLKREEQFGRYVSFFALEGPVRGLTLKGFKYPLENYTLSLRDWGLAVSNEIAGEEACVSFEDGKLMMIQSMDQSE